MNINNFDIIIRENTFYITHPEQAPDNHDLLDRINHVLNHSLIYGPPDGPDTKDHYAKFSPKRLQRILRQKYKEIQSQIPITEVSKKRRISYTGWNILFENSNTSLAQYLPLSDLASVAGVKRSASGVVKPAMFQRAQELGYEGHNPTKANQYLRDLVAAGKKQKPPLSPEQTLYNAKTSLKHLFEMFVDILKDEHNYKSLKALLKMFNIRSSHWQYLKAEDHKIVADTETVFLREQAFTHAYERGEINLLEFLLMCGALPNQGHPLYYAAHFGFVEVTQKLLTDKNVVKNQTVLNRALNFACGSCDGLPGNFYKSNEEIVPLLLTHGALADIPDEQGIFPLSYAARAGNVASVNLLLSRYQYGQQVLNQAFRYAWEGNTSSPRKHNDAVIVRLLESGANPDSVQDGITILYRAAQLGLANTMKWFFNNPQKIQQVSSAQNSPFEHTYNTVLNNALKYACGHDKQKDYRCNPEVIEFLLNANADAEIIFKYWGSLLHDAARLGYVTLVDLLFKRSDQRSPFANKEKEYRVLSQALEHACGIEWNSNSIKSEQSDHGMVVKRIIEQGLKHDIDLAWPKTNYGGLPLIQAVSASFVESAEALLDHYYTHHAKEYWSILERALDYASSRYLDPWVISTDEPMVKLLLRRIGDAFPQASQYPLNVLTQLGSDAYYNANKYIGQNQEDKWDTFLLKLLLSSVIDRREGVVKEYLDYYRHTFGNNSDEYLTILDTAFAVADYSFAYSQEQLRVRFSMVTFLYKAGAKFPSSLNRNSRTAVQELEKQLQEKIAKDAYLGRGSF